MKFGHALLYWNSTFFISVDNDVYVTHIISLTESPTNRLNILVLVEKCRHESNGNSVVSDVLCNSVSQLSPGGSRSSQFISYIPISSE